MLKRLMPIIIEDIVEAAEVKEESFYQMIKRLDLEIEKLPHMNL